MLDGTWTDLADAVLGQETMLARARFKETRPTAGLSVSTDDADELVEQLLHDPLPDLVRAEFDDLLVETRAEFAKSFEQTANRAFGANGTAHGGDAFFAVCHRARLSTQEAEVLALLVAIELDTRRQRLCVFAQDDVNKLWPTSEMIARVFGVEHAGISAVGTSGALRRSALLVPVDESQPWSQQMHRVNARVVWGLLGVDDPDPALPHGATVEQLHSDVANADGDDTDGATKIAPIVLVNGPDRVRRRQAARDALGAATALITPAPSSDDECAAIVREATVSGASVIVESMGPPDPLLRVWIGRSDHLRWALSTPNEIPIGAALDRPWIEYRTDGQEADEQAWIDMLGHSERNGHRLTPDALHGIQHLDAAKTGDIDSAVRRLSSGLLDGLAVRVRPSRTWDDLVLPDARLRELRELCQRYRLRTTVYEDWGYRSGPSTGLVAMFSGPSGTGKTMTAEVIAGELGLDLYRIDLSAITSKWVGETEKNLERIFSAAATGNLVLFFDEADAIFGKRSEVNESNDRYANMEVSYLLQRLETYNGLAILATNLANNLDRAFMRRIHLSIEFKIPDEPERRAIWSGCFPTDAPTADIDLDELAKRFELAGGNIRSAALSAAFLAAAEGEPIRMSHVVRGLAREMRKLGRMTTEAMFGPWMDLLDESGGLIERATDS